MKKGWALCYYCGHEFNPRIEIVKSPEGIIFCSVWCCGGYQRNDKRGKPTYAESWGS